MDNRYYEILRNSSREDFYQAINNPEAELYEVLWDLFETTVIEPAEIFDSDFRSQNQFRYGLGEGAILEFFPKASYFDNRKGPDPYSNDTEAAGVHLKLSIQPYMSCLFSVGFQVWGRPERMAFKQLWQRNRKVIANIFHRAKPMVFTATHLPAVEHAPTIDELLDNYFSISDPENFLEFQYSFARFDENVHAENFMVYMSILYHSIRGYCLEKEFCLEYWLDQMKHFYSGRLPDLPTPMPCTEITIRTDI